ncbi:MAG: carboxymuconolactone decarboxylase family protein [Burkholderiaceae bacterium]|jgi:AhpD family alkylhydroperoxidase|nr:carboxymuconolactone decarboxylase family protein [Gemmatimonadales bacterium]MCO5120335.1 carboxymuconolactone decarboxylase family protein [Burkholderiaceae bacterium]MEB2318615.1 carboxymuconolactone decarboxylase family protein [Pseudomonadota bacterium]
MTITEFRPRLDLFEQAPEMIKRLSGISQAIGASGEIDETLALLVDVRASQLNGCAFCLDMHVKQARIRGERELRLHHVAGWRESPLFTPPERAALAWTEALTRLEADGVADELYVAVGEHFSERALVFLTLRVMMINGWNRLNVAFRTAPGSRDEDYGLDKAGLA